MPGLAALATGPTRRQQLDGDDPSAGFKRRRAALRRSHSRRAWRSLRARGDDPTLNEAPPKGILNEGDDSGGMSVPGYERRFGLAPTMSGLPLKADIERRVRPIEKGQNGNEWPSQIAGPCFQRSL